MNKVYRDFDDLVNEHYSRVSKYTFFPTYRERMQESWQAKAFGITMPLFFIINVGLYMIWPPGTPFNIWLLIAHGVPSLWFIISYGLLINKQSRDRDQELKDAIWRDSQKSF
jgi:hypothetical protein